MTRVYSQLCVELLDGAIATDADRRSSEFGLSEFSPSLTQQSQEEEANINTIVRRFGLDKRPVPLGGFAPPGPLDAELNTVDMHMDLRTALEQVRVAQESFSALPAEVRRRFENDALSFVEFCQNPDNVPEMRKLGLAIPEPKAEVVVEAVPPK